MQKNRVNKVFFIGIAGWGISVVLGAIFTLIISLFHFVPKLFLILTAVGLILDAIYVAKQRKKLLSAVHIKDCSTFPLILLIWLCSIFAAVLIFVAVFGE